jgi:hypothetical protein
MERQSPVLYRQALPASLTTQPTSSSFQVRSVSDLIVFAKGVSFR